MLENFSLPERVRKDLEQYLLSEFGAQDVNFTVEYGSKNGDSYSSDIYRVIATDKGKLPASGLRFILKSSPTFAIRRLMFNTLQQFSNEHNMYTKILPALHQFQLHHLPNDAMFFTNYPKVISSNLDEGLEYIILEDLTARGFESFVRAEPLNFNQCRAVFKTIALLHAASFAFKDQHPEAFEKLVEPLTEAVFKAPLSMDFDKFLRSKIGFVLPILDEADSDIKERLVEFQKVYGDSMIECVSERTHAVIIHGDSWIANLMQRKKESSTDDIDICFVDWQITRYGTPVIDLAYFIFCCTDSELRLRLPELLNIYYTTLAEQIRKLKSDPDILYSHEVFQEHVKKYMKFGLGMALMSLLMLCSDPNDIPNVIDVLDSAPDFGKFDEIGANMKMTDAYKRRMAGVCRDCVRFGYI